MFYWRPPWNISIFLLRISLDRFDGSTGYYLYDARGSVSGITNEGEQMPKVQWKNSITIKKAGCVSIRIVTAGENCTVITCTERLPVMRTGRQD